MCRDLDTEFDRLRELYDTAGEPALSRDAWLALSSVSDQWTEEHAPWGTHVTVTPGDVGQSYAIDASGSVYDAVRASFRQGRGNGRHRHGRRRVRVSHLDDDEETTRKVSHLAQTGRVQSVPGNRTRHPGG
jgi:hypothetical protein